MTITHTTHSLAPRVQIENEHGYAHTLTLHMDKHDVTGSAHSIHSFFFNIKRTATKTHIDVYTLCARRSHLANDAIFLFGFIALF